VVFERERKSNKKKKEKKHSQYLLIMIFGFSNYCEIFFGEVLRIYRALGFSFTEDELEEILGAIDAEEIGTVNYEMFLEVCALKIRGKLLCLFFICASKPRRNTLVLMVGESRRKNGTSILILLVPHTSLS